MRHVGCLFLLSALFQNLELEQMDEHMGELNLNMCKSSCFLRETFAIATQNSRENSVVIFNNKLTHHTLRVNYGFNKISVQTD